MFKIDRDEEFSRIRDWLSQWKNKSSKDQLKLALEAFIKCIDLTDEIRQYKGDINEVYRVWKLNCWDCDYQYKVDEFFQSKCATDGLDWVFARMTTLWASILLNSSNKKYIVKKFLKNPGSYLKEVIIPKLEKILEKLETDKTPVSTKELKLSEPLYSIYPGKHGSDIRQTKGEFSLRQPTIYRQENQ